MEHVIKLLRQTPDEPTPPEHGGKVSSVFRRVMFPGQSPVLTDGMVWLDHIGGVERSGLPPETMSSMHWLLLGEESSDAEKSLQAQDWGAVLSLVLNRRVEVLDEISMGFKGDRNVVCVPISDRVDSQLMAPVDKTSISDDLRRFMGKAYGLDDESLNAVSAALRLHHAACLLYVSDLNAAYALVVAGIERLSRTFGEAPTEWAEWPEFDRWDRLIAKIDLNPEQASAVRAELLADKHLRLQRTFVSYVLDKVPIRFWKEKVAGFTYSVNMATGTYNGGHWEDPTPLIPADVATRDNLLKALRGSYQTRSDYVHGGIGRVTLFTELQNAHGSALRRRQCLQYG
jgi:hypothetical protein